MTSFVVDYLSDNYSITDADRLSEIPIIAGLFMREDSMPQDKIRRLIDKVAQLNKIEKRGALPKPDPLVYKRKNL